jgi:hypothetical protein
VNNQRMTRRQLLGAVLGSVLALALVTAGCSSAGAPAAAPKTSRAAGPLWLCRPGQAPDPCAADLTATAVTAAGTLTAAGWPHTAAASQFDCFYVYPTVSLATTSSGSASSD